MAWLESPIQLAAELGPPGWTVVAAERSKDRAPRLTAAASFDATSPSLKEEFRQLRMREHLPFHAAIVLWPEPGDQGVDAFDAHARGRVSLPKARVIRERVAPFVRSGGRVRAVLLPHEAVVPLAALAGWSSAFVLVMQPPVACLAVVAAGIVDATYVSWEPVRVDVADAPARLLARYQFASRLMPYVRARAGEVPDARVAVCGRYPDLRVAMVPIVEDLDREVDVLDSALVGESGSDPAEPDETSARQLAWAVAAGAVD